MNQLQGNDRVYGLDVMRSMAILLVIFFHGNFLLQEVLPGFPYFRIPDGVEIFFVLSGFLIGGILIRDLEERKRFTPSYLFYFWKRRWLRTLPAYYVALLLNIWVVKNNWNVCDPEMINFKYFLFVQNLFSPGFGFFWESWSLSVEEWFYLIFPLMTLVIVALTGRNIKKSILLSISLAIILPLLFRHWQYPTHNQDGFWYDVTYRKMVVYRIDSIIYGVLGAWISFYYNGYWKRIKVVSAIIGVIGIFSLLNLERDYNSYLFQVGYFPLMSLYASMLLPIFSNWKRDRKDFFSFTSKISYSLYLVHLGLVAMVMDKFNDGLSNIIQSVLFLLYLAVSYGLAFLLYRFIEKPFMDLRK